MFAQRRLLWLPFAIALVGFVLVLVFAGLSTDLRALAGMFLAFFFGDFTSPPLFTFFIAGFLAPRAGYLVGFLLAIFLSVLVAILAVGLGFVFFTGINEVFLVPEELRAPLSVQFTLVNILWGTLAGAFAGWYRDFLRRMNEQSRARRAAREAELARKRREEKRTARRPAS